MSTHTEEQSSVKLQPLVKIREMDHLVLRVRDVDKSLRFCTEVLGLQPERVVQFKVGEVPFPSFSPNNEPFIAPSPAPVMDPTGRTAPRNKNHSAWSSSLRT